MKFRMKVGYLSEIAIYSVNKFSLLLIYVTYFCTIGRGNRQQNY